MSFRIELANKLSEKIGFTVSEDHVRCDKPGRSYYRGYIRGLRPYRPLLMMRGPGGILACILPDADFQRLEDGEITVEDYIDQAWFSYGHYWGGDSLLSGVYWQPLETTAGIHDTAKISRYLQILCCRTWYQSLGVGPTKSSCSKCQVCETTFPFSKANVTGSWENEVQELDGRTQLMLALKQRLQREFGFELGDFLTHRDGKRDEVRMLPSEVTPNKVTLLISVELHNDLLYRLENGDLNELADSLTFTKTMEETAEAASGVLEDKNLWWDLYLKRQGLDPERF